MTTKTKRGKRSGSLGLRLTLLLALLLVTFGAISAYLAAHTLGDLLEEQAKSETLRLVDTVKRSTRHDMLNTRWEDVHQTIHNIARQPDIDHVRIYNKDGKIMYSSVPEEIRTVVDLSAEACYQCHAEKEPLTHLDSPQRARIYRKGSGGRILAAIDVIYNEPGCAVAGCHASPDQQSVLGVVDIGVSLNGIDQRISTATAGTVEFSLVVAVLVCGLVALFVFKFVTRPVRRLLSGIRRVSEGDLHSSISVASSDEFGQLAYSFNLMTEDLRKARDELQSWAQTLEQQVDHKTRDLKIAQAQVIRSEKLSSLGILAAGVAHELNSPLTGILTFAHLLLQDAPKDSRQYEDLQLIIKETNRCASIIRQLLQFSREGGPQSKVLDIRHVIRNATSLVEHQALFHDVEIHCEFDPELPSIACDGNQMQQVFLNLLINAAEAMPEGGTIRIRASSSEGERIVLQFTDTGVGIPPEKMSKVFDPFFTSKEAGKGTGLGLSVSHGIVQQHGGTLSVESEVGVGTTFTISLPAAVPEEAK